MSEPLRADSPEVVEALRVWHEAGRAAFARDYPISHAGGGYDLFHAKTAKERKRFIALDNGDSGAFLVDRATGDVFSIKGYGRPNRRVMHFSEWGAYWSASTTDALTSPQPLLRGAWLR